MGYSFKSIANKNITKHTAHKKYEIAVSNSTGSFDGLNVFAYSGSKNSFEWDAANNTLNKKPFRSNWKSQINIWLSAPPVSMALR